MTHLVQQLPGVGAEMGDRFTSIPDLCEGQVTGRKQTQLPGLAAMRGRPQTLDGRHSLAVNMLRM